MENALKEQFTQKWKLAENALAVQDVDEFVSSSDLEKYCIASLVHQWMLCSEWVHNP